MWAPVILIILRIAQGIGVGGEWGGSVVLSMEWGHRGKRGFITSWPQFGVPVGLLLANAMVALFSAVSGDAFFAWGWRIPFLLSFVLVGIGLYIRLGIIETPIFTRLVREKRIERQPLAAVLRRNWREVVLAAFLRLPEQAPFYIFTVFIFSYGVSALKMDRGFLTVAVVCAAALELFSIPFFGYLSDIYGRKKVYLVGAVVTALWAIPYYFLLGLGIPWLVFLVIVLSLIPHDVLYGPQAALIAESFTGRLRYSGASLGYQSASIIAGGPAPLIAAALFAAYVSPYPISGYVIFISILGFIATVLLPDRSKSDISVEYDAAAVPSEGGRA
ncbi:MAG: MFS transporter [Streptosporangiaceae bacterium]